MQSKLWRLAASAIVVTSLSACSTMSNMTGKVAQTWDQTWSSLGGKSPSKTAAQTAPVAQTPCLRA